MVMMGYGFAWCLGRWKIILCCFVVFALWFLDFSTLFPSFISSSRPFLLSGMFLTSNCGGAASLLLVVLFGVGLVLLYGAGSACITEKERAFTDGTGIPSTHLAMIPPFACQGGEHIGGWGGKLLALICLSLTSGTVSWSNFHFLFLSAENWCYDWLAWRARRVFYIGLGIMGFICVLLLAWSVTWSHVGHLKLVD